MQLFSIFLKNQKFDKYFICFGLSLKFRHQITYKLNQQAQKAVLKVQFLHRPNPTPTPNKLFSIPVINTYINNYILNNQAMAQSICDCHCGTRIDLDEQLIQERETWKQKYLCLQKQFKIDIETIKENIYAQCSELMQQQFSSRESNHNTIVNQKNVQIKDLISKIIGLETRIKVLEKEKELVEGRVRDLEDQIPDKEREIKRLDAKSQKIEREWQTKYEQGLTSLRKKMANDFKDQIKKLETDRQHLLHKVKQFEAKYQKIIPEVEKLKATIQSKTVQMEVQQADFEKVKKAYEQNIGQLKQRIQQIQNLHSICPKHIKKLENKTEELERELERNKKVNREVRVEPVYIDRPVEVEKVIEKIVQVEKVVKKVVESPNAQKFKELEQENKRLKGELNSILAEIKEMEEHYSGVIKELESNIQVHEDNTVNYKKQRQHLTAIISEKNNQIGLLEQFLRSNHSQQNKNPDNEKITIHVKKDGTYQKNVQKIPHPKRKI